MPQDAWIIKKWLIAFVCVKICTADAYFTNANLDFILRRRARRIILCECEFTGF